MWLRRKGTPINTIVYAVVFSMSSLVYAIDLIKIDLGSVHHVTHCSSKVAALYCTESNTTPFSIGSQLSIREFPEYMYARDTDTPKGFFYYLSKGLREGDIADNLAQHRLEQCYDAERDRVRQGHVRSLRYLEKNVLRYNMQKFDADTLINHMREIRKQYLGTDHVSQRTDTQLIWRSDLVLHEGTNDVSWALSYFQKEGISHKKSTAWKKFWHNVRSRGKGLVHAGNVDAELNLWDEQGRGDIIRALCDRVYFVPPKPAEINTTLTAELHALRVIHGDDPVGAAARLYRALLRIAPFKGYNGVSAFSLMNAWLLQKRFAPIPFSYESNLSSIAPYSSPEFLTEYVRHLAMQVTTRTATDFLDLQYDYSVLISAFNSAQ